MNFLTDWVLNVLIAVLTAISIYLFTRYIHPFFLGVVQRTPDLSGHWKGFHVLETGNEEQVIRMHIRQIGTNVYATDTITKVILAKESLNIAGQFRRTSSSNLERKKKQWL